MTPTPLQAGTTQPVQAPAPSAQSNGTGFETSDFETFLNMLTAQIQNQDPLNPMQSSDFAVQLATFSGVEQQVQTNDLLRTMSGDAAGSALESHAGWIGMDARIPGTIRADGTPLTLHFDPPTGAVRTDLVVKTTDGMELHRHDITGTNAPFEWNARTPQGRPLLEGEYVLEIASLKPSGAVETSEVFTYSRIDEIRTGGGKAVLLLENGREIPAGDVSGLKAR